MAQWTVSLSPEMLAGSPGGNCTIQVKTNQVDARGRTLHVTLVVRDGETIRSDDPAVIEAINGMARAGFSKVVTTLAVRPANPTYDVDTRTREPLPEGTIVAERTR